jgi:hypothetical protein
VHEAKGANMKKSLIAGIGSSVVLIIINAG